MRRNLGKTEGFREGMSVFELCHRSIRSRNALFKQERSASKVGEVRLAAPQPGEPPPPATLQLQGESRCLAIAHIPGALRTPFRSSHASRVPARIFIFPRSPNHFRLPPSFGVRGVTATVT